MTVKVHFEPLPKRTRPNVTILGCLLVMAGFLTLILMPNFVLAQGRGKRGYGQLTSCKSNLKNLATALEMYSEDHRGEYPVTLASLTPNYLKVVPNCPRAGRNTYSQTYTSQAQAFTMWCSGHHHANVGTPENFPQYTSRDGLIER